MPGPVQGRPTLRSQRPEPPRPVRWHAEAVAADGGDGRESIVGSAIRHGAPPTPDLRVGGAASVGRGERAAVARSPRVRARPSPVGRERSPPATHRGAPGRSAARAATTGGPPPAGRCAPVEGLGRGHRRPAPRLGAAAPGRRVRARPAAGSGHPGARPRPHHRRARHGGRGLRARQRAAFPHPFAHPGEPGRAPSRPSGEGSPRRTGAGRRSIPAARPRRRPGSDPLPTLAVANRNRLPDIPAATCARRSCFPTRPNPMERFDAGPCESRATGLHHPRFSSRQGEGAGPTIPGQPAHAAPVAMPAR